MVQPLARPLLIAASLAAAGGCATTGGVFADATRYVSTAGQDTADGSESAPFATIGRALSVPGTQVVVLGPGAYEGDVTLSKPVVLVGPADGAMIEGHVAIRSAGAGLRSLGVSGGVDIRGSSGVRIEHALLWSGGGAHALEIVDSQVRAGRIQLSCGIESCVHVRTSTVDLERATLVAEWAGKRGLYVENARVAARQISVRGTSSAQIFAGPAATLHLEQVQLHDAKGLGLVAIRAADLRAAHVQIGGAKRGAVLLSRSRANLSNIDAGATEGGTVGVQGGHVTIADSKIHASTLGVVTVTEHVLSAAKVSILGGSIHHGGLAGLSVDQGHVQIDGTRFVGHEGAETCGEDADLAATPDAHSKVTGPKPAAACGEDAIRASGPTAQVEVTGARIEHAAGYGVGLYNDAFGTVSATITQPRLGGVIAESTAGHPVVIRDSRVSGCIWGPGILAVDAGDVAVESVRVDGCGGGGIVAGRRANVRVDGAWLHDNARYGVAAFDRAQVDLARIVVTGSPWSTFAACDGARISAAEGLALDGPVGVCP